jgi:hypothetical protein
MKSSGGGGRNSLVFRFTARLQRIRKLLLRVKVRKLQENADGPSAHNLHANGSGMPIAVSATTYIP